MAKTNFQYEKRQKELEKKKKKEEKLKRNSEKGSVGDDGWGAIGVGGQARVGLPTKGSLMHFTRLLTVTALAALMAICLPAAANPPTKAVGQYLTEGMHRYLGRCRTSSRWCPRAKPVIRRWMQRPFWGGFRP